MNRSSKGFASAQAQDPAGRALATIEAAIESYRKSANPAEFAAAESMFELLKRARAIAIEADIALIDENGVAWRQSSKEERHEAAVNATMFNALMLGALIIDSPTAARLQREARVFRAVPAQKARSGYSAIADEIILRHAHIAIAKFPKMRPTRIAGLIENDVQDEIRRAHESGRITFSSLKPNTIQKKVRTLMKGTTEQSSIKNRTTEQSSD
jgi:hypothetical protein